MSPSPEHCKDLVINQNEFIIGSLNFSLLCWYSLVITILLCQNTLTLETRTILIYILSRQNEGIWVFWFSYFSLLNMKKLLLIIVIFQILIFQLYWGIIYKIIRFNILCVYCEMISLHIHHAFLYIFGENI